jgi:phospholipid-binding lipoprotein MlaA
MTSAMKRNFLSVGRIWFLVMFCLMFCPDAQALAYSKSNAIHQPAVWHLSDRIPGPPGLSPLPIVKEKDAGIELARISRCQIDKMRRHDLVVAMQMGEKLNFFPELSSGSQAAENAASGAKQDSFRSSGLENRIQVCAASFEDEKVVEEPEDWNEDNPSETIADPLEPVNRVFFAFNNKFYFWVLKPVAKGYRYVIPEPFRIGIRNMFTNIAMPIRAINCLLQGKVRGFGRELLRFVVNSTAGFLGFADVARIGMHVEAQDEDFGQTLGFFGVGPGIFINWPILGPSSIRDSVGMAGDYFVYPVNYLVPKTGENIAVRGEDRVNRTSLSIGDYEALIKSALDPYVAVRNAYFQYRRAEIEK